MLEWNKGLIVKMQQLGVIHCQLFFNFFYFIFYKKLFFSLYSLYVSTPQTNNNKKMLKRQTHNLHKTDSCLPISLSLWSLFQLENFLSCWTLLGAIPKALLIKFIFFVLLCSLRCHGRREEETKEEVW